MSVFIEKWCLYQPTISLFICKNKWPLKNNMAILLVMADSLCSQMRQPGLVLNECILLYWGVGWVDIGTSTGVPSRFVYFNEKTQKTAKKVFWSSDLLRKGHSFLCQALYNGPKFFSLTILGWWTLI
jgi:hypothetical protein